MTSLATKESVLEAAGYRYNFDRQVYFNRAKRKLFSIEFIADNTETKLVQSMQEPSGPEEWKFYFNVEPSEAVKREIQKAIG